MKFTKELLETAVYQLLYYKQQDEGNLKRQEKSLTFAKEQVEYHQKRLAESDSNTRELYAVAEQLGITLEVEQEQ